MSKVKSWPKWRRILDFKKFMTTEVGRNANIDLIVRERKLHGILAQ